MLNILFYTDTPNFGGAEKQMNLLAKHLRANGYSVSLAYGAYSKLAERREELTQLYDKIFVLPAFHKHDPRQYFELKRILVRERQDLLHLHLWNPGACRYAFFACPPKPAEAKSEGWRRRAAKATGIPIITTEHDPFELHGIKRLVKLACLRRTAHTIAISNCGLNDMKRWYNIPDDKISVVHNGIEADTFTPCHSESRQGGTKNLPDGRFSGYSVAGEILHYVQNDIMITCIAELHPRKGQKYLIEAFEKLQPAYPNLHLQLVGSGPLEKKLKSQYGSNPNIHFLGWRDDVPAILRASNIFVLPSLKEAFGLSVLEAMANGVVVVATNNSGPAEIIENGKNGILVTPANADAIAEVIRQLLADPNKKRMLEEAAKKRVTEFSAEKMAEKTMKVYVQCHSEPHFACAQRRLRSKESPSNQLQGDSSPFQGSE